MDFDDLVNCIFLIFRQYFVIELCGVRCDSQPDIVSWLEKKTGPPALALASVEEATAFVAGQLEEIR